MLLATENPVCVQADENLIARVLGTCCPCAVFPWWLGPSGLWQRVRIIVTRSTVVGGHCPECALHPTAWSDPIGSSKQHQLQVAGQVLSSSTPRAGREVHACLVWHRQYTASCYSCSGVTWHGAALSIRRAAGPLQGTCMRFSRDVCASLGVCTWQCPPSPLGTQPTCAAFVVNQWGCAGHLHRCGAAGTCSSQVDRGVVLQLEAGSTCSCACCVPGDFVNTQLWVSGHGYACCSSAQHVCGSQALQGVCGARCLCKKRKLTECMLASRSGGTCTSGATAQTLAVNTVRGCTASMRVCLRVWVFSGIQPSATQVGHYPVLHAVVMTATTAVQPLVVITGAVYHPVTPAHQELWPTTS